MTAGADHRLDRHGPAAGGCGNIDGKTRVLTTAIMLKTRQGNFPLAIGLGMVLLVLAFLIHCGVTQLPVKGN